MTTTKNVPPADLNPAGDICIPLTVPDNWEWLWLVHKALTLPSAERFWADDLSGSNLVMRDNWEARVAMPFANKILDGVLCSEETQGACFTADTTRDVIQFFYNDPFSSEPTDPRPKLGQWERYEDARARAPDWLDSLISLAGSIATLDENAGYFPNDVFLVPLDGVNPLQDFIDFVDGILSLEIPHVRIDMQGTGQFEVELLTIPAGGSAIIRWDTSTPIKDIMEALFNQDLSGISNTIFAELQRDFTQIPPETLERQSVEIEFDTQGAHFVEIFFVPKFDYTAVTFLGMGGGIRSVTACGNLEFLSGSTGEIINIRNHGIGFARSGVIDVTTCGDLEDCIETSTTINNIENSVTNINNNIENITENTVTNEYPEYPEPTEDFDGYCGASWQIANYLNDFIQDVISDAQTITFAEFVALIIQLHGFKFTIVKALWDFVITNLNPNLSTEVTDALPKVAEHIYCKELDMVQARAEIIADATITSDAEACYVSAIDALTEAKFNELVYLGSLDSSQDCSELGCGWVLYDFTKGLHGFSIIKGQQTAQGIKSTGSGRSFDVEFYPMSKTFYQTGYQVEWLYETGTHFGRTMIVRSLGLAGETVSQSSALMPNTIGEPVSYQLLGGATAELQGLKVYGDNGSSGSYMYLRKLWIRYNKGTGVPQNGAPVAP